MSSQLPPAEPKQQTWKATNLWLWLGLALLAVLIGLFGALAGAGAAYLALRPSANPTTIAPTATDQKTSTPIPSPRSYIEASDRVVEVVQEVGPSVVTVVSFQADGARSSGSGVIISRNGHIVTNEHVIDNANRIEVMLADGSALPARLVGSDLFSDIAVVQVDQAMPVPARWGDSDQLSAGQTVIAIGSPLGDFVNTVTVGVISNVSRSIDVGQGFQLQDLIQTDAAINRGNSGGPLLNLAGEVVGINTLIVRDNGSGAQAEGLGFALPSNSAKAITDQIIEQGRVSRPYVGIEWRWISPQISSMFELPVEYGVFITGIVPGSPADQAGLERGDILVSFGGQSFDQDHPFINLLFEYAPGDKVAVEYLRAQRPKQETELTLTALPGQ